MVEVRGEDLAPGLRIYVAVGHRPAADVMGAIGDVAPPQWDAPVEAGATIRADWVPVGPR